TGSARPGRGGGRPTPLRHPRRGHYGPPPRLVLLVTWTATRTDVDRRAGRSGRRFWPGAGGRRWPPRRRTTLPTIWRGASGSTVTSCVAPSRTSSRAGAVTRNGQV